jgi:hypothetical protein
MGRLLALLALGAAAVVAAVSLPDIKRYFNIRSM